jgi:hypothetical protein
MINSTIQLIVPFYKDSNKERNYEILKVLAENSATELIDLIVLIVDEDVTNVSSPKIRIKKLDSRPTYNDAFRVACDTMPDANTITIIANADIYFKDEDLKLINAYLTKDRCFALSRWDVNGNEIKHHASWDSQDCWIFRGVIRDVKGDFHFGMPGCDNRIAYEIESVGYKVENPSCSIKSYHVHKSNIRNYVSNEKTVVPKPYKLINPTYIQETGERKFPKESLKNKSSEDMMESIRAEYDHNTMKTIMQSLACKELEHKYMLAVCIATIQSRVKEFSTLISILNTQIARNGLADKVQLIIERDGGLIPIGGKRNKCTIRSNAEYVISIDDDDIITNDYLTQIIEKIEANPDVDCVTIEAKTFIDDKLYSHIIYQHDPSTDRGQFYENEDCNTGLKIMKKSPGHLCAIKRKYMLQVPFPVIWGNGGGRKQRADNGSDVQQLLNLKNSKLIKTAVHINKPVYFYHYNSQK